MLVHSAVLNPTRGIEAQGRGFVWTLLASWSIAVILVPFYVFPSGLPQPADVLALGVSVAAIAWYGMRTSRALFPVLFLLFAFVVYVVVINLGWGAVTGRGSLLMRPVYYVFNAVIFAAFLVLYTRLGSRLLRTTMLALGASVMLQVALSPVVMDGGLRQSLFFNNPNQLGYFGLLSATLFAFGAIRIRLHPLVYMTFFVGALYLTALSMSKAAIAGTLLLLGLAILRKPVSGLLILAVVVGLLAIVPDGGTLVADLDRRFSSLGVHGDDSLAGRGYDRFVNHAELLVLGAGEGGYERFRSALAGTEMHSTWGSLAFSYGVIGSFLFLLFLGVIFFHGGAGAGLYFMPAAFYGLTHNGIRFTMLWVLLAFMVCVAVHGRGPRHSGDDDARGCVPRDVASGLVEEARS